MSSNLTITLIRHGQTENNTHRIIQGSVDTKLNATGILQAQILGSVLPVEEFDFIYSSDFSRAYDTARELVRGCSSRQAAEDLIQTDTRLRERSLGSLDGHHVSVFLDQCTAAGLPPDEYTPAGAESPAALRSRIVDFIENQLLAADVQPSGSPGSSSKILLVSHGATIREIIKYFHSFGSTSWNDIANSEFQIRSIPPNTAVNEFRVHFDGGTLDDDDGTTTTSTSTKIKDVECLRLHDVSHLNEGMMNQVRT